MGVRDEEMHKIAKDPNMNRLISNHDHNRDELNWQCINGVDLYQEVCQYLHTNLSISCIIYM